MEEKNNNLNDDNNNQEQYKDPADEILEIIEKYKKDFDRDPATNETEQEQDDKEVINSHFADLPAKSNEFPTSELDIESHLTTLDDADGTVIIQESGAVQPTVEATKDTVQNEADNEVYEEKQKPAAVRALKKVYLFFSNSSFVLKAAIYIGFILIIAAFLSYNAIAISNDVFAFIKSEDEVIIEIPPNSTHKEVIYLLEKNDIIEYSWVFNLFLIYQFDDVNEIDFIPGDHAFSPSMNYSQIVSKLTVTQRELKEVSITIKEGQTIDEIIDMFLEMGIGTREKFVEAINEYPFKHEFVQQLDSLGYSNNRKYRLEGYLFPDTYFFYTSSAEYIIINKLLNRFDQMFWEPYKDIYEKDLQGTGLTFDDIVTLASMVQMEARNISDFEPVSYVFRNRLKNSSAFPRLDSDATIQYVLEKRKQDLTSEDLNLDNPYNTRKYEGLPPGAICNPGTDALEAAVYPDPPTDSENKEIDAFFFVSDYSGKIYYAVSEQQHNKNKAMVDEINKKLIEEENNG